MVRLVDLNMALDEIARGFCELKCDLDYPAGSDTTDLDAAEDMVRECLYNLASPAASLLVHGQWKLWSNARREKGYERYCSVCSHRQVGMTLYCPSCGAKMDGGNDVG